MCRFYKFNYRYKQALVKAHWLCFNCLKSGHVARDCLSSMRCKHDSCEKKHHTLLHSAVPSSPQQQQSSEVASSHNRGGNVVEIKTGGIIGSVQMSQKVHLKIMPVTVWSDNMSSSYYTYCFLDQGSDTSLCMTNLMRRLGIVGTKDKVVINTINGSKCNLCFKLSLKVQGEPQCTRLLHLLEVLAVETLPNLSGSIPLQVDVDHYNHLAGIKLPTCKSN